MTLFEYLAIAFSLVLSFAGVRLVQGLPHALRPERRYPIHVAFVAWQLVVTVTAFWVTWSFRETTWTLPTFALVLAGLAIVYYNACVLIPDEPAAVASWRDYYYAARRRYFGGWPSGCSLRRSRRPCCSTCRWSTRRAPVTWA